MNRQEVLDFYRGKRVLITGHTGFKGSWLSQILLYAGAKVSGYALEPPTEPSMFQMLNLDGSMDSEIADVRDYLNLREFIKRKKPEIVFHLAAQPLVRESYQIPRETYDINVMGTVNLLEALRLEGCARSIVNVTTDKVYLNKEVRKGYVEDDPLDGYDPYSNSKSCSDLVTHSYWNSFFREKGVAVSTVRAGNVIGGGDYAKDRIVPDCLRACEAGQSIGIRNPHAVRPYQHVLEPLFAYLLLGKRQAEDISLAGSYNVGPEERDAITTGELADIFVEEWGEGASRTDRPDGGPHEAGLLLLDSTKIKEALGFENAWDIRMAVRKTVEWAKAVAAGESSTQRTIMQIKEYSNV